MKISTIQDRINSLIAKRVKKEATLERHLASREKKIAKLSKMGILPDADRHEIAMHDNEAYWLLYDIDTLTENIERCKRETTEIAQLLDEYNNKLTDATVVENTWVEEVPQLLKQMQQELIDRWDEFDKKRRDTIKSEYKRLDGSREFFKIYKHIGYDFMQRTDEQIHDANVQSSKDFVLDLINRVKNRIGDITDWRDIRLSSGAYGPVLTGYVQGTIGRCYVDTIVAGGPVQRTHLRTIIRERA